ncbi:pyridoxamine 5'-phosphate oxidase family protein [Streptomyces sp. SID3343]|uniref:pyridoxamine 5'-phosphate oxidase family protein n=1 Tax=Streptomyces sp. SID3343 TaxID=2690260 RepID=UPI001370F8B1|nr:pyridoxamine 5'-phosphate oxidase family protein [Streptomyces sp. SID3343]MYV97985.1 pyridoxamine 5'-phosphate oxidase family protein [Streptomyces sp. SID3343]
MTDLDTAAPAFVAMAHSIVWASIATVDRAGRPRTRILHPYWVWENGTLTGWVATVPTATKRAHIARNPFVSCNYWTPTHDTCAAECRADLLFDEEIRERVWNLFRNSPEPLGYDPASIGVPGWEEPMSPDFAVMRLAPWRLRVFPGSTLMAGTGGAVLTWQEPRPDLNPRGYANARSGAPYQA